MHSNLAFKTQQELGSTEIGSGEKLVVGIFDTIDEAKEAILALHENGFPATHISVVSKSLQIVSPEEDQYKSSKNRILNRILDNRFIEQYLPWLVEHFYTGKFFVLAIGTPDEVAQAYGILIHTNAEIINHNLTRSQESRLMNKS
jgi:hypothetical protein